MISLLGKRGLVALLFWFVVGVSFVLTFSTLKINDILLVEFTMSKYCCLVLNAALHYVEQYCFPVRERKLEVTNCVSLVKRMENYTPAVSIKQLNCKCNFVYCNTYLNLKLFVKAIYVDIHLQ